MRPTVANDKKHGIYSKQSRNPKQSRNSLTQSKLHGRNTNQSISPKAYADFRFSQSSLSWYVVQVCVGKAILSDKCWKGTI